MVEECLNGAADAVLGLHGLAAAGPLSQSALQILLLADVVAFLVCLNNKA